MSEFLQAFTEPLAILGIGGQLMFSMRFIIQWIVSEKNKMSTVPIHFWFFSLGGGLMLLLYAVLRREPIIALGQAAGLVVYVRNLMLIYAHKKRGEQNPGGNDGP